MARRSLPTSRIVSASCCHSDRTGREGALTSATGDGETTLPSTIIWWRTPASSSSSPATHGPDCATITSPNGPRETSFRPPVCARIWRWNPRKTSMVRDPRAADGFRGRRPCRPPAPHHPAGVRGSALRRLAAATAALLLVTASTAQAADVISPRDGDTVSSTPTFAFGFLYGTAEIELSHSPDLRTNGPETGSFVDRAAGDFAILYNRVPLDGLAPWPVDLPLKAGLYFWHAQLRDDGSRDGNGDTQPYGPVRRLTVRDEPAAVEGWTLRADRLRTRERCPRVRVRGKVAWRDNDETPKARLVLSIRAGGRTLMWRQGLDYFGRFDAIICTAGRRLAVTPKVVDRAGHVTAGQPRAITVN